MLKLNLGLRLFFCFSLIFFSINQLDEWLYDEFFYLRGVKKEPSSIVLIKIRDAKIYELIKSDSQNLPFNPLALEQANLSLWYPPFYTQLISRIAQEKPKLILFTQTYDWIDQRGLGPLNFEQVIFSGSINDENRFLPPTRLTQGSNVGFNNLFPDPDGVVRQTPLFYSYSESLAMASLKALNLGPTQRDLLKPLRIDYRGPAGSYLTMSAEEALRLQPIEKGIWKDKIVILGRESSPSNDFNTPFGRMRRSEIQANIIDTLIRQHEIQVLEPKVSRLVAALCVGITGLIALYYPLTVAWLAVGLLGLGIFLIALFLFSHFKIWVGFSNILFSIIGTHLILLGYIMRRQEESQWVAEREIRYFKELDQFKNNFISLFSHDLKTPIAKIKAITQRIINENPALPSPVVSSLKGIDRTSGELARLISDILKITRIESLSLEKSKGVLDLNRLVETSVGELKFLADEKQIQLTLDLEPLFSIEGDEKLIQEVITNLIENAIKYSPPHSQVVIRTEESGNQVHVSVKDEGMGIKPEDLPHVTEKFFRTSDASQANHGTGLGLYLARYFVELHQGKIEIQSTVGKGTQVTFSLPIDLK